MLNLNSTKATAVVYPEGFENIKEQLRLVPAY
ncbi:MAG: hypothetical protein ACI9A7_000703 [Cyclobacteriaceae bacterium]|jgi:hypothetical protein